MKNTAIDPRDVLREAATTLRKDREIGTFGSPLAKNIFWLAKNPKTEEEVIENIYERLRTMGYEITVTHNPDLADPQAILEVGLARIAQRNKNEGADA